MLLLFICSASIHCCCDRQLASPQAVTIFIRTSVLRSTHGRMMERLHGSTWELVEVAGHIPVSGFTTEEGRDGQCSKALPVCLYIL